MTEDLELTQQITATSQFLLQNKWKLVTAESCTGGGLSFYLTSIGGSSDWFERGYVTYSNESKIQLLNVRQATLDAYGAVSCETVTEMAQGALLNSHADVSLAITGTAGPSGGTEKKPVGTVWFGLATKSGVRTASILANGDRTSIRRQAILFALEFIRS